LDELSAKMDTWHAEISPVKEGQITGEERLRERLATVYGGIMNYQGRPTDSQIERLEALKTDVNRYDDQVGTVIASDLPAINAQLEKEGLKPITVVSREEFLKEK
jgi:N-dimethylarginine dimethylaminohydrolase